MLTGWLEDHNKPMKKFLDKLPLNLLIPIALLMALAPFLPEPHLIQKIKMLAAGTLSKPIDIFDLIMHGTPLALLILKLAYMALEKNK